MEAVIEGELVFEEDFMVRDYTAKIVKSIILMGNRDLSYLFEPISSGAPKRLIITPLYRVLENNRIKAIYPRVSKPKDPIKPVRIAADTPYKFYVSAPLETALSIINAISSVGRFYFGKEIVRIKHTSFKINQIDISEKVHEIAERLLGSTSIKVVFMSPTKLKNPFILWRARRKKLGHPFPSPSAVFLTPLIITLSDLGLMRLSVIRRLRECIETVLDVPITSLKTFKITYYAYSGKTLPALIGYVKYFTDNMMLREIEILISKKLKVSFLNILARMIITADIYGVGDGRAAGFGKTSIEIIQESFPDSL